ncbi:hypothetical protein CYMTET_50315 [Cymbomonas tetramitiformis]|uniref:BED-type domain-containing protein n=1 Tax=Cymbomonas tetramitiformis TaxID=36881 RepID=A0AAE0EUW2_9CHLO|nr:hypothetical protein CYMTET_50315 [Cymbomonas tetramitiformis]
MGKRDEADTWEPIEHLPGSEGLIKEFRIADKKRISELELQLEATKTKKRRTAKDAASSETGSGSASVYTEAKIKGRKAACWEHFLERLDDGKTKGLLCKLCGPESEELALSGNTSNMRSHLAHCHKPIFAEICEAEDSAENASVDTAHRQGALDNVSAPYPPWKRDALHKKVSLWIARNGRPLSICEHDIELREFFSFILKDAYTLPTYKLVVQNIIKLSVDGLTKVRSEIDELREDGVLPSIAGDIWSEGTVSLLGIFGYYINNQFEYKQRVIGAIPFGGNVTTLHSPDDEDEDCEETILVVKDTITESVHTTTSDQGSNIASGWKDFDGNECNCHILARSVLLYMRAPGVKPTFSKMHGIVAHFSHSILDVTLLLKCQVNSGKPETRPVKDNDTRSGWGGGYKQCLWLKNNQGPIQLYDVENPKHAKNAVNNPDGSRYKDHILLPSDWEIIRDSTILLKIPYDYVQIAQATSYPTINLVLPMVGLLIFRLNPTSPLKVNKVNVTLCAAVATARGIMYEDFVKRYFTDLQESKLEDYVVATAMDPRYKSFNFIYFGKWRKEPTVVATKKSALSCFMSLDEDEEEEAPVPAVVAPIAQKDELALYLAEPD